MTHRESGGDLRWVSTTTFRRRASSSTAPVLVCWTEWTSALPWWLVCGGTVEGFPRLKVNTRKKQHGTHHHQDKIKIHRHAAAAGDVKGVRKAGRGDRAQRAQQFAWLASGCWGLLLAPLQPRGRRHLRKPAIVRIRAVNSHFLPVPWMIIKSWIVLSFQGMIACNLCLWPSQLSASFCFEFNPSDTA